MKWPKKIETKFGNRSKAKTQIVFVTQTRRLISSSCMKNNKDQQTTQQTILHGWSNLELIHERIHPESIIYNPLQLHKHFTIMYIYIYIFPLFFALHNISQLCVYYSCFFFCIAQHIRNSETCVYIYIFFFFFLIFF